MKRFAFGLEKVLKFKERHQWLAEIRQKSMAEAVRVAQADASALVEQLDDLCRWLHEKVGRTQDPRMWMSLHAHSVRVEQAIENANQKVASAQQELDRAAAQRKQANIEVETLLKLRQRKWEEYRISMQRATQEQLDEISCSRWFAARATQGDDKNSEGTKP